MIQEKQCSLSDIKEKLQRGENLTTLEEIFYLLNVTPEVMSKDDSIMESRPPKSEDLN